MPFPYTFPITFEDKIIVQCDWNNDGHFDGTGEYLTDRVLNDTPIVVERGRDQIRQLAPPMAGRAECELWNWSRDYSPDNSTGPLYGNLLAGRRVRIRRTEGASYRWLFNGFLDDLPQHPELGQRSVSLPCLGALSKLRGQAEGQKVSTPLYQSITTDVALGYILDAAGWPSADRVLDTGQTTLDWWWLDEEDAFSAAVALLVTEGPGAALYEDGQGRIVFESRHYRILTARCLTSQATFNGSGTTMPVLSPPFTYNPRLKDIINSCTVTQKERAAAGALGEVWALGSTVTLAPSETRKFDARDSDPFTEAATPSTGGSDYTLTAGTLSSVALNRTSGQSCTITLTASTGGATLTGLRLRAKTVTVSNTNQLTNTLDTSDSQDKYGIRSYPLSARAEVDVNTLQSLTNAVVSYYQEPRSIAEITVAGVSSGNLTQLLNRDISDRVTLVETQSGINAAFFIEQIGHSLHYGGRYHVGTFGLEKAGATNYFILDTSTLDGTDVLAF